MLLTDLNKNTTKYKLISNTVYQLLGKIVSMGITLFVTVVITRYYGREGYGWFSLIQAWPAFVFIVVDFGLNAIASREITKEWSSASKYFSTVLSIRAAFSLIVMLLLAVILQFTQYDNALKSAIILNLWLILTQSLYATTNIIFQSKLRYDLSSIGLIIGYIFILFSILILVYYKAGVEWLSFAYVLGGLLTFLVSLKFIKNLGVNLSPSLIDSKLAKTLFIQSLPLGIMFVFSQINFKSDVLLLSVLQLPSNLHLSNTESVAIYGLAYKIFEVFLVLPTFFMNAAYPILVTHMQQGKDKLKKSFVSAILGLFIGGLLVGIVGSLLSKLFISFLGGAEFANSVLVLQILMVGIVLYFVTQPFAWLLVTLDKQKYLPYIYLVSAIFNVSANAIFIPKYSYIASSVITHLSEFLVLILLILFTYKAWKEKYG